MRLLVAMLALACVLGGCADSGKSSDDNRFGGFYGGVNGGVAR
jgi:hypothetical protein